MTEQDKNKKKKRGAPLDNKFAVGNKVAVGNKGPPPSKWTEEKLAEVANHFMEWADDENNLILREFACEYKRGQEWLPEMAQKSDVFANALKYAKTKIGARREKTAGKPNGLDAGIVKATLATYDYEHREVLRLLKSADIQDLKKTINILCRGQMKK